MKNIVVEIKISVDGFNGKVNTTERQLINPEMKLNILLGMQQETKEG